MDKGFDKVMEKEIRQAVENFSENPHWKNYYDTAPSGACRRYISLEFYYSENFLNGKDRVSFDEERKELEDKFGVEDWKHLAKYAGNNPFRGKCRKKIRELSEGER